MPETILFVCEKFPEMRLVVRPADVWTDPKGLRSKHVAGKTICFTRTGLAGEFRTSDPDEIEFIRECPSYKVGHIIEVSLKGYQAKPGRERVATGAINSAAVKIATPAPEGADRASSAVKAVKTPKKKK